RLPTRRSSDLIACGISARWYRLRANQNGEGNRMTKERMEEMNKLNNIINYLDDSADADDFHKFVDTCQINYEEGVFNEILRFMQSQAERVQEMENEMKRIKIKYRATKESHYSYSEITSQLEQQNKRYRETMESSLS